MKEYFTSHRDSVRINEFLNGHSEDSRDFQIVYRLRKMGERFVDGSLTLQEVEENRELLLHSTGSGTGADGVHPGDGWMAVLQGSMRLTPLEQRIREEIVHPSFCKPVPKGTTQRVWYKLQRIWKTRWKHSLVYEEWWLPALVTKVWCWVKREQIVKIYE